MGQVGTLPLVVSIVWLLSGQESPTNEIAQNCKERIL